MKVIGIDGGGENSDGESLIVNNVDRSRKLVYSGKMSETIAFQTRLLIVWFEEEGIAVCPNLRRPKKGFWGQMNLDEPL